MIRNSSDRDFCGLLVWKMKFSSGDTAECHTLQFMCRRQFQTGAIAGRKLSPIFSRNMSLDDGANRVQNIPGRKMISFCQLRPACGFRVTLGLYDLIALVPELEARR